MAQPKKKLKIWRVLSLRERARYLGTVKAPDARAAEAAAVAQFKLDEEQRKRLRCASRNEPHVPTEVTTAEAAEAITTATSRQTKNLR